VLERHLSVRAASQHFGYNEQYLRRLLRAGRLEGVKIGQVWLIKLASLEAHLRKGRRAQDRRRTEHRKPRLQHRVFLNNSVHLCYRPLQCHIPRPDQRITAAGNLAGERSWPLWSSGGKGGPPRPGAGCRLL